MRESPILFSGPMVRAILDGRKTQTRRVIPEKVIGPNAAGKYVERAGSRFFVPAYFTHRPVRERGRLIGRREPLVTCPYGDPGDRLWVREGFWAKHDTDSDGYRTIDCGPGLDLGAESHPGIQYVATPANAESPDEPGDWWEAPPDGWDGGADYAGKGTMEWLPWDLYSKKPSIHMPRWASRLTLEITGVRLERLQAITEEDARAEGVELLERIAPEQQLTTGERFGDGPHRAAFACLWDSINSERKGATWSANPWVWVVEFRRVAQAESRSLEVQP